VTTARAVALAACVLGLGSTGGAWAEEGPLGLRADLGGAAYTNNDGLRVLSTSVGASQKVRRFFVRGGGKVDMVTAASVDLVTAASRSFDESRTEGTIELGYDAQGLRGALGYTRSVESDTRTHMVSASGSIDLLARNLTLGLGYALGLDSVGMRDAPLGTWRDRTSHRVDATVTRVLGPSTVLSGTYTFQDMLGFLSSAYRRVPILPHSPELWTRQHAQWVAERHPEARGRHAATVLLRHALSARTFVHGEWRGYLDTWSMRSNALEAGFAWDLDHGFLVGVSNRFYAQSGVSFYRAIYTVNRAYLTRDRRLSEFISNALRLDLRYRHERFEVLVQGVVDWTRYADYRVPYKALFEAIPDTWAFISQLALGIDL